MTRRLSGGILVVAVAAVVVVVLLAIAFYVNRTAARTASELTAAAVMSSPSGDDMGVVTFRQEADLVLVAVDVRGLTPGGHAVAVHSVGKCAPDFQAAGDHFSASESGWSFVHPNWKRETKFGDHGGDLPNIYAHSGGSARADFLTDGFALSADAGHSIFDADGSAVVIHEKPLIYGVAEGNTGSRVACGVISHN